MRLLLLQAGQLSLSHHNDVLSSAILITLLCLLFNMQAEYKAVIRYTKW